MTELKAIKKIATFKREVQLLINDLKNVDPIFKAFIDMVLKKTDVFILGGFLRDVSVGVTSRDLDIMIDMSDQGLNKILDNGHLDYTKNRLSGYKIRFKTLTVDCWSTENNWAFKRGILKSKTPRLKNIANGTFLNFDSLVLNLNTFKLTVKNYNNCILTNKLDIVRQNSRYKKNNPTKEANIIRSFYLSKRYNLSFSEQLTTYILEHIITYDVIYGNYEKRLLEYYKRYSKYESFLTMNDCKEFVNKIKTDNLRNKIQTNNKSTLFG